MFESFYLIVILGEGDWIIWVLLLPLVVQIVEEASQPRFPLLKSKIETETTIIFEFSSDQYLKTVSGLFVFSSHTQA